MPVKPQRVAIGERVFLISPLDTETGIRAFFRLTKVGAPALMKLLESAADEIRTGKSLQDLDAALLFPAAVELIGKLEEKDFAFFYEAFLEVGIELTDGNVAMNAEKTRKHVFDADYGTLIRWMFENLRVNFASFPAGWSGINRRASSAAE